MNKITYIKYIEEFIKEKTKRLDAFHISFTDIEKEYLSELEKKMKEKEDIVFLCIRNKEYNNAVKYRNNPNIRKVILLSVSSVLSNDSLKDFNEYSILPLDIDYNYDSQKVIWKILKEKFDLNEEICKFINALLNIKMIELSRLITFINAVISDSNYKKTDNNSCKLCFFSRLHMINCWKSNKLLTLTQFRKLVKLSDPMEIEKRIDNIVLNSDDIELAILFINKNIRDKKFDVIFKKYNYENLPNEFKKRTFTKGKHKRRKKEDDTISYMFFEDYCFEKNIDIDNSDKDVYNQFEEIIDSYEELEKRKNKYIELLEKNKDDDLKNISEFIEYVRTLSIYEREELINYICSLEVKFKELIIRKIKIYPEVTPFYLQKFCNNTKEFRESYENIANFLYERKINISPLIEKFQSLFCKIKDNEIHMSYYHPAYINYLNNVFNHYENMFKYQKEAPENNIKFILLNAFKNCYSAFEFDYMTLAKQKYSLNQFSIDSDNAIYKIQENSKSFLCDISSIADKICEYINCYPYKACIDITIIGRIDFAKIINFYKIIDTKISEEENLFHSCKLHLLSSNLLNQIDNYQTNAPYSSHPNVDFKFTEIDNDFKLVEKVEELNAEINILLGINYLFDKESYELNSKGKNLNSILTSLQISTQQEINKLFKYKERTLNLDIIRSLYLVATSKNEKLISLISEENTFADNIFYDRYCKISFGNKYTDITFSKGIESISQKDEDVIVKINLKRYFVNIGIDNELLDEINIEVFDLDNSDINRNIDLNDIQLAFALEDNKINIIIYYDDRKIELDHIEKTNIKEFCSELLNLVFCNDLEIFRSAKKFLIRSFYNSAVNIGSSLLVNYIDKYFKYSKDMILKIKPRSIKKQSKLTETDSYYRMKMLEFFNSKTVVSERMKTEFRYGKFHSGKYLEEILEYKNQIITNEDLINKVKELLTEVKK